MASGDSSSGPDRTVGSENPCKCICLSLGLTDNPTLQYLVNREGHLKEQFDRFSMVEPDLLMFQQVNGFWMRYVKDHAERLFSGCHIQRHEENKSVVILCGTGWDQSSPVVGGRVEVLRRHGG